MAKPSVRRCCPAGRDLRLKGVNRTGNLLVPNSNYCVFEDWMMPILDQMKIEQERDGVNWTPSKMIDRFGKEINNPDSVLYWAHKNGIPVFSPALTDGSVGDMFFFHSWKNGGLRCDIIEDIRAMNMQVGRRLIVRRCCGGGRGEEAGRMGVRCRHTRLVRDRRASNGRLGDC